MNIECPGCKQIAEVPCTIAEGQHLRCPYCNLKFQFRSRTSPLSGQASTGGLSERRVDGTCLKSKKWIGVCGVIVVCLLGLLGVAIGLFNRHSGTPVERLQREMKEADAALHRYVSEERLDLDLQGGIDGEHVFGLRWGEMPRNKKYKLPCRVTYAVSDDMFSEVTLLYLDGKNDRGLSMLLLTRKGCLETRVESLAALGKMVALAERASGSGFDTMTQGARLLGLSNDDDSPAFVSIAEPTLADSKKERIFMVMRRSEEALKKARAEKVEKQRELIAKVDEIRLWYERQLKGHNLLEHSFTARKLEDGAGFVYCLCLTTDFTNPRNLLGGGMVEITITEGRGMVLCQGPVDQGYGTELLAARKLIYQADGK